MVETSGIFLMSLFLFYFTKGLLSICNLNVYSESRPEYNGFMGGINTFIEHVTRSRMDCDRKCAMSTKCKSYTFDQVTKECHLFNFALSNTVGLTARPGAVYFVRMKVKPGTFTCPRRVGSWYPVEGGDGCISVRPVHTNRNHDQAVADCESDGGRLFLLNNLTKQSLFMNLANCPGFSNTYLVDGRNDNATDYYAADAYRTSYDEVVPWTVPLKSNLSIYKPAINHCLLMHNANHLDTCLCSKEKYYMCERNY